MHSSRSRILIFGLLLLLLAPPSIYTNSIMLTVEKSTIASNNTPNIYNYRTNNIPPKAIAEEHNYSYLFNLSHPTNYREINFTKIGEGVINFEERFSSTGVDEYIYISGVYNHSTILFNNTEIIISQNSSVIFINSNVTFENTIISNRGHLVFLNCSVSFNANFTEIMKTPNFLRLIINYGDLVIDSSRIFFNIMSDISNIANTANTSILDIAYIGCMYGNLTIKNSYLRQTGRPSLNPHNVNPNVWIHIVGVSYNPFNTFFLVNNSVFQGFYYAIYVINSNEPQMITNSFFSDNYAAIQLSKVHNFTIMNNTFENNVFSISAWCFSENINITRNLFSIDYSWLTAASSYDNIPAVTGVELGSSNSLVANNTFINLERGVVVSGGNDTILRNRFSKDSPNLLDTTGIYVEHFSKVTIGENYLENLNYAILLNVTHGSLCSSSNRFETSVFVLDNTIHESEYGIAANSTYFLTVRGGPDKLYISNNVFESVRSIKSLGIDHFYLINNTLDVSVIDILLSDDVIIEGNTIQNGSVSLEYCYSATVSRNHFQTDEIIVISAFFVNTLLVRGNKISYRVNINYLWSICIVCVVFFFLGVMFYLRKREIHILGKLKAFTNVLYETKAGMNNTEEISFSEHEKFQLVFIFLLMLSCIYISSIYDSLFTIGISFSLLYLYAVFVLIMWTLIRTKIILKIVFYLHYIYKNLRKLYTNPNLVKKTLKSVATVFAFIYFFTSMAIAVYISEGNIQLFLIYTISDLLKAVVNPIYAVIILLNYLTYVLIVNLINSTWGIIFVLVLIVLIFFISLIGLDNSVYVTKERIILTLFPLKKAVMLILYFTVLTNFIVNLLHWVVYEHVEYLFSILNPLVSYIETTYFFFVFFVFVSYSTYFYIAEEKTIKLMSYSSKKMKFRKEFFEKPILFMFLTTIVLYSSLVNEFSFWFVTYLSMLGNLPLSQSSNMELQALLIAKLVTNMIKIYLASIFFVYFVALMRSIKIKFHNNKDALLEYSNQLNEKKCREDILNLAAKICECFSLKKTEFELSFERTRFSFERTRFSYIAKTIPTKKPTVNFDLSKLGERYCRSNTIKVILAHEFAHVANDIKSIYWKIINEYEIYAILSSFLLMSFVFLVYPLWYDLYFFIFALRNTQFYSIYDAVRIFGESIFYALLHLFEPDVAGHLILLAVFYGIVTFALVVISLEFYPSTLIESRADFVATLCTKDAQTLMKMRMEKKPLLLKREIKKYNKNLTEHPVTFVQKLFDSCFIGTRTKLVYLFKKFFNWSLFDREKQYTKEELLSTSYSLIRTPQLRMRAVQFRFIMLADLIIRRKLIFEKLPTDEEIYYEDFSFHPDAVRVVLETIRKTKVIPTENILKHMDFSDNRYYLLIFEILYVLTTFYSEEIRLRVIS